MRTIEILNWYSFYNLVVILLLSFFFVFYSFFLICKKSIPSYRLLIWIIACLMIIVDVGMNLLFSATNVFDNWSFPLFSCSPIFFRIAAMMIGGIAYFAYFQWNLVCEYRLNDKPVPKGKQIILQKVSSIAMHVILLLHFLLYGIFIIH